MYLFLLWVISNSLTPHMELFFFSSLQLGEGASQVALMVKNRTANAGDPRSDPRVGLIPGSGRSLGEGKGYPLQYACLENPMDRGAWWATVHRVAKSQTRLE